MTDDPFERAAEREQEIKRQRLLNALEHRPFLRGGPLVFFAVWAAFLAGHYALFGNGPLFFIHACIFGVLFIGRISFPMLVPSALWAPIVAAHIYYGSWNTLSKLHLFVFLAITAFMFFFGFEAKSERREMIERSLTL